ncbi:KPN_01571 family protein [Phytobacter sp. SCO41]
MVLDAVRELLGASSILGMF